MTPEGMGKQKPAARWAVFPFGTNGGFRWSLAIALVSVSGGLLFRVALDPVVGRALIYLTFYPAILLAAVLGGWRAGVMATVMALGIVGTFYLPRAGPETPWIASDYLGFVSFGVMGFMVSWVAGLYHRARRREAAAQANTAEREWELRLLTDSMPGLVGFIGLDLKYKYMNQRYEEWFGEKRETLLNKAVPEVVGEDAASVLRPFLQRALRGEEVRFEAFVPYRKVGPRWVDSSYVPRRSPSGEIIGIHVLVTDITERRKAEEELRLNEARLRQAVQVARFGVFEHDHLTQRITCSVEHCHLFGLPPGEPLSVEVFLERIHHEDRGHVAELIAQSHDPTGSGTFEAEHRVLMPDGRVRWVGQRAQTFFAWEGASRRPVRTLGAAVDITARKEVEQHLHAELEQRTRLQEELERLVRERTSELSASVRELEHFSHALTHDMRAPLRAMQGFSQMLQLEHADNLNEAGRDYLRRIAESASRLDHLVVDALSYSKVILEDLPLEPVDIMQLLRGMIESYPEFQEPKATIELPPELPIVHGNRAALTQCFSNLLHNAVKFVEPGRHPHVRIRSERWETGGEAWVRLNFEDNGIGINREELGRIYGMFQRLSRGYEGTGIGLALVRKAVEKMKGNVGVESEPGRGSRFWLEMRSGEM